MQNILGRSPLTINEYYSDLRTFFRYIIKQKGLVNDDVPMEDISISCVDIDFVRSISSDDILDFFNYCIDERENKPASRARKTTVLRHFFKHLKERRFLIEKNPMDIIVSPKRKKALPKYLTLQQSQKLLDVVDGKYKIRDECILTLFLNCGLRLSELVGININDINDERILKVCGKGNKEREIYLNDACMEAIEAYKKVRPTEGVKDKKALFISRNHNRISNKTVQYLVYKYLNAIGLEGYSVHKLRHTAATLMYQEGGVDIRVLQDILGHENLGTTQIYTHISHKQSVEAMQSNPLGKSKKQK
ncbi:MAG: tyrosine recombinase XerC [Clostridia bacterium]|nr:tyrosine recombinase XerC [Clostridia bacterium]